MSPVDLRRQFVAVCEKTEPTQHLRHLVVGKCRELIEIIECAERFTTEGAVEIGRQNLGTLVKPDRSTVVQRDIIERREMRGDELDQCNGRLLTRFDQTDDRIVIGVGIDQALTKFPDVLHTKRKQGNLRKVEIVRAEDVSDITRGQLNQIEGIPHRTTFIGRPAECCHQRPIAIMKLPAILDSPALGRIRVVAPEAEVAPVAETPKEEEVK